MADARDRGRHEEKGKVHSNSPCLAGARGWVDETGPIKKAEQLVFCGPRSNFTSPSRLGGEVLPKATILQLYLCEFQGSGLASRTKLSKHAHPRFLDDNN